MNTIDDKKSQEKHQRVKIWNKTAPASYKILEKLEAGIALLGSEVKAIKQGHADLSGSHVKIIGSEAYLVNSKIFPYKFSRTEGYDEKRSRKLLLHKKELIYLKSKLSQGNTTIVPILMYDKANFIKIQIALAKGKKQFEKKRQLKEKDLQREAEQALKREY